jgi:hypothetical protein
MSYKLNKVERYNISFIIQTFRPISEYIREYINIETFILIHSDSIVIYLKFIMTKLIVATIYGNAPCNAIDWNLS